MTEKTVWIYYRLFYVYGDATTIDGFVGLLSDVVIPVVDGFGDKIRHFHFFNYRGAYKENLEGGEGVKERLTGIADDDQVGFIRLRVLVAAEYEEALREKLLSLINESDRARGYELPVAPYNPERDLGERFGQTRTQMVMDLIEAASQLALSFARGEEGVFVRSDGGPSGLVHLVANTLQYKIIPFYITRIEWGKQSHIIYGPNLL